MKRRMVLACILAGTASTVLGGCGLIRQEHKYRYRLTVEVETPQGLKSASSVIESIAWEGNGLEGRAIRSELHGEAVAVDLPGGVLFALLKGVDGRPAPYASAAYAQLLPESVVKNQDWRIFRDAIARQTSTVELPSAHYPLLVWFRDVNDPTTVELADPANLGAIFDAGVRLRRITIEVTDDPVTTGIEKKLVWLGHHPEPRLDSSYRGSTNPNLSQRLAHGDFLRV